MSFRIRSSFAFIFSMFLSAAVVAGLSGCDSSASGTKATGGKDAAHGDHGHGDHKHGDHDHGHAGDGPHKGHLIELGDDQYHAELVHDDATHTTTIYLLDGEAKKAVAIDAKELIVNLVVGGKPQQFNLPASPETSDAAGRASRFASKDEALCEALDAKGTTGRLNIEIEGKAFVGKIAE